MRQMAYRPGLEQDILKPASLSSHVLALSFTLSNCLDTASVELA